MREGQVRGSYQRTTVSVEGIEMREGQVRGSYQRTTVSVAGI